MTRPCYCGRKNAEDAIQQLNGTVIGKQSVRLSWGRSPANKQVTFSLNMSSLLMAGIFLVLFSPFKKGYRLGCLSVMESLYQFLMKQNQVPGNFIEKHS